MRDPDFAPRLSYEQRHEALIRAERARKLAREERLAREEADPDLSGAHGLWHCPCGCGGHLTCLLDDQ